MMVSSPVIQELSFERQASRSCPVCRGRRSTHLYRQRFEQLSGARLLDGYDVVICGDCGAGFADGIPEQAVFDRYYTELSKYDSRGPRSAGPAVVEPRFHDIADIAVRFIPSRDTRVFEIGCASGGLLRALHERGVQNLSGSDPSPACIRAATELFGVAGTVGTVFTVACPEPRYDFLVLTGVMEHLRDLDRTVDRFHDLLSERGRVFLEVPDASRYEPQLDAPFQEFSVEHINFFSATSLANLMRARGFRVLETGHTVRPLHEASCPCTYGVFERAAESSPVEYDSKTESGLRRYIEGCRTEDERIRGVVRDAIAAGEHMIVWGVGAHTLRLLASGGLDASRVALFVDSNPNYQDQHLRGVRVASPGELEGRGEPILISSRGFQREIEREIRDNMGLPNRLILLYGAPAGGRLNGA
jgi:SAM-dependent methyltransferase